MPYTEFVQTYGSALISGSLTTLLQFILASLVAIGVAIILGLIILSPIRTFRAGATAIAELFRGTSLLVQLYWVFFVFPLFGLTFHKFTAGFITVGLCFGAYGAELVRGAVISVPRGQWEAALALNLSPARRMWRIILPQALIIMLPPWGNMMIEILKGTALVSLISVADLMFVTRQINNSTFMSAQAFGTALLIYYVFARFLVTPLMRQLERIMARRVGKLG